MIFCENLNGEFVVVSLVEIQVRQKKSQIVLSSTDTLVDVSSIAFYFDLKKKIIVILDFQSFLFEKLFTFKLSLFEKSLISTQK